MKRQGRNGGSGYVSVRKIVAEEAALLGILLIARVLLVLYVRKEGGDLSYAFLESGLIVLMVAGHGLFRVLAARDGRLEAFESRYRLVTLAILLSVVIVILIVLFLAPLALLIEMGPPRIP